MSMSAANSQFAGIVEAARDRKSSDGVDTMIVLSHLAQMRLFMLRQGIEFFPRQDTFGFRNTFLTRVIEENEIDARLEGIVDDFCLDGKGLWFFRPVRDTYRIMWFRGGAPGDEMYRAYYDASQDLEELDLIYSFKARSTIGASVAGIQEGGNKVKWVRLKIRRDKIIEMISDEKPSFDTAIEPVDALGRKSRETINSLGFIPAIEAFNIMRSTGMDATGDFASVANHILVHDALCRNIRENIRFFGNPTLVSSRPRQDLLESDEAALRRPTISSQSGFSSAGRPSTRHSLTGAPSLADGLRIPRLITNLDNTDRVQYITPNAVSGDQNQYARQYREEIRTLLGGVDELGISSGATAYEIRSLYGRAATTAARKCQGLLSYGLCKLLALMIYHEERIFQESFAGAAGIIAPVAPIREDFADQAQFDEIAALYRQDYDSYRAQVDAAIQEAIETQNFPPGVIGLVPDGDRRVEWRWKGPVFEESTEDILNNSIVVRNLQELGVNSIEALRHLFPNKTAEERASMLNGYPFRMVQATQESISTFLSLVAQMQGIPHPQAPDLPLLADARLDITPFLYRALDFLKSELTYAGEYGDAAGASDPSELDPIDRARADAGLAANSSGGFTFLPGGSGSGSMAGGLPTPVRQFERDAQLPGPGTVLANDPTAGVLPGSLPLTSSRLPERVRFGDADLAAPSNAGVFADLSARFLRPPAQPAEPVEPVPAERPRRRRVSKRRKR